MTSEIKMLPKISWEVGSNHSYEVRSHKEGTSFRFELWDKNSGDGGLVVSTSSAIKIHEFGYCYQQWVRNTTDCDLNVKMFATEERRHVYFVVTDLKHKEIELYSEELNQKQWEKRLYKEDPNLQRHFLLKIFGKTYLPKIIDWEETPDDSEKIWKKSYEESEVGLIRTYRIGASSIQEEQVKQLAYTQSFEKEEMLPDLMRGYILRMGVGETTTLKARILDQQICHAYPAEFSKTLQAGTEIFWNSFLIDREILPLPLITGLCFTKDGQLTLGLAVPEDLHLDFMANKNLAKEELPDITNYVRTKCLTIQDEEGGEISAIYTKEQVQVTRTVHRFLENKSLLPSIHITIDQSLTKKILASAKAFIPVSDDESQREKERYGRAIDEKLLKAILLNSNTTTEQAKLGVKEFDKAAARSAKVELFISFNRMCAELRTEQGIHTGYKARQLCARIFGKT